MTAPAKGLQIGQRPRQIGPIPDRLYVVDFKPMPIAALDALPIISLKRLHPQRLPSRAARDPPGMACVFLALSRHRAPAFPRK